MSPFKMNNPGCPCCAKCPCACYPFNGNFKNNSGFAPAAGVPSAAHSFVPGKHGLGLKIPYHATAGRNVVKVPPHKCFSLTGGFSCWFWLYSDPACDQSGDGQYTAGADDVGVTSYILSKGTALNQAADPPEWLIAFPVNKRCNGSSLTQIAYGAGVPVASGGGVQSGTFRDANYSQNFQDDTGFGPAGPSWEFYFMYYDPSIGVNGTMYFSIDAAQWQTKALTLPVAINDTKPLHILEQVGQQAQYFIMDELGFCKDIPPVDAAGNSTLFQMQVRCTSLFAAGVGKACNNYE